MPENRDRLLDDLRTRTGLPVKRVAIGRRNFLNDTAELINKITEQLPPDCKCSSFVSTDRND